jgi:hypothetical protein
MNHASCSIPLCERTPSGQWDTLHNMRALNGTLGAVPICEFHMWLLEHGAKINIQLQSNGPTLK